MCQYSLSLSVVCRMSCPSKNFSKRIKHVSLDRPLLTAVISAAFLNAFYSQKHSSRCPSLIRFACCHTSWCYDTDPASIMYSNSQFAPQRELRCVHHGRSPERGGWTLVINCMITWCEFFFIFHLDIFRRCFLGCYRD